jgi:pyridoxal phosphate enzyme (YggS family)
MATLSTSAAIISKTSTITESLLSIKARLNQLTKELSRPNPARLVAVSKTCPVSAIREAYDAGQRRFGENYVHELIEKAPQLPADIEWVMIGHLQSNKIKSLIEGVPNLACFEALDSEKTATALDKRWGEAKRERKLEVMVQVNTSGEESKEGVEPDQTTALVAHVLQKCPHLRFTGLMTIGKLGDPTPTCFELLANTATQVSKTLKDILPPSEELHLSMGMSGDYELAIRYGSTNVRIGSTIFGKRPPKDT